MTDEELEQHMLEQRIAHKAHRRQQRQTTHKLPAVRAAGPLRPWPWARTKDLLRQDTRDDPCIDEVTQTEWITSVLDTLSHTDIASTYEVLCQVPYHGKLASAVLQAANVWYETFHVAPTPFHGEKQLVLQEAMFLWQHNAGLPPTLWLTQVSFHRAQNALQQIRIQESAAQPDLSLTERRTQLQDSLWTELSVPCQIDRQLQLVHQRTYHWPDPQLSPFTASPVLLYVYSGRRRKGDFKFFADQFIQRRNLAVQVMLIDLAISDQHDAIDERLVSLLLRWMHGGAIAALMVAPPCETWTEARRIPCHNSGAPRPVRTAEHPFGTYQLTGAELSQVLVSSQLLFTAIRLILGATLCQVPGVMEHPREPKRPERASIWKLPWICQLMRGGVK